MAPIPQNASSEYDGLIVEELHWWTSEEHIRQAALALGCHLSFTAITFAEHKVNGKSKGIVYINTGDPENAAILKEFFNTSVFQGQRCKARLVSSIAGNPFRTLPKDAPGRAAMPPQVPLAHIPTRTKPANPTSTKPPRQQYQPPPRQSKVSSPTSQLAHTAVPYSAPTSYSQNYTPASQSYPQSSALSNSDHQLYPSALPAPDYSSAMMFNGPPVASIQPTLTPEQTQFLRRLLAQSDNLISAGGIASDPVYAQHQNMHHGQNMGDYDYGFGYGASSLMGGGIF